MMRSLTTILLLLAIAVPQNGRAQNLPIQDDSSTLSAGVEEGKTIPAKIRGNYIVRLVDESLLDKLLTDSYQLPHGTPPFFIEKSLGIMGIGMDLVSLWSLEEVVEDTSVSQQDKVSQPLQSDFCDRLRNVGIALTCSPGFQLTTQNFTPNDPLYDSQPGLKNRDGIKARGAWSVTRGSNSGVVVVADTGIDFRHPDLAPNMWVNPGEIPGNNIDDDGDGLIDNIHGANFVSGSQHPPGFPMDDHGHGTHIGGIIGAKGNNGIGVAGVNWDTRLFSLKIADHNGTFSVADVIHGLNYLYALKVFRGLNVRLVNISWGQYQYDKNLYDTMAFGDWIGIVFIVAAGNSASNNDVTPFYPANYNLSNMVVVGSADFNKGLSSFSNYGVGSVDIVAPGRDILSTGRGGSWYYSSGTSQATAFVTGSAALLLAKNPALSNAQLVNALIQGGDFSQRLNGLIGTSSYLNAEKIVTSN